jgi:hypothetical protein
MRKLLINKIQCPDGTILESRHRHDFQMHTQEDGREYFIDGGLDYQRIGYSDTDYIDLSIYADDQHEKIRENFVWGRSYDKNKNPLPEVEYILLKDLEDDHVETLCYFTLNKYPDYINKIFVDENNYRIDKKEKSCG